MELTEFELNEVVAGINNRFGRLQNWASLMVVDLDGGWSITVRNGLCDELCRIDPYEEIELTKFQKQVINQVLTEV